MSSTRSWRTPASELWRLAWPIAITGQLVVLGEAIIIFWLGRLLGSDALAVEATLRPVMQAMTWMLLAIATGVSALVAQSVGARDKKGLGLVESGLVMVLVAWGVIAAVTLPLAYPLSDLLGSAEVSARDVRHFGLPLLLVVGPGLAMLQVLLFAASAAGWTRLSLVRMVADLCLSAALVPLCVLAFGLPGAPIGQALAQFLMIAVVWRALYRQRDRWNLGERDPSDRFRRDRWKQILDIGLPPQLARIAMYAAFAYLLQLVAREGRAAVAGFGIAFTFLFVAINFVGSIGRAVGIVLGQSIGAKDAERGRRALRTGLALSAVIGVGFVLVMTALAGILPKVFVDDAQIESNATSALRIMCWAVPFVGVSQVFLFALTAVKATKRLGLLGIIADLVGVVFAILWWGDGQLVGAAWSVCVSNIVRAGLFAALGSTVVSRKLEGIR